MLTSDHPYFSRLKSIILKLKLTPVLMLTALLFALALTAKSGQAFYVGSVEIKVVDANQTALPNYYHQGQYYVMGRYNQRYMLRVINHSSERFELVMTVDGRDVINGSAGHYDNRGYVVGPYSQFNIEGFRRSDSEVAAFRFTTPGDSYAGRLGTGMNIGVIGVALFSEQEQVYHVPAQVRAAEPEYDLNRGEEEADSLAAPTPSRYKSRSSRTSSSTRHSRRRQKRRESTQSEIGTRYGERCHSVVENIEFIRALSQPN